MSRSVADLRQDYTQRTLLETDAHPDPIEQFRVWFDEALAAGQPEPNALALATASPDGVPSCRIVLLKGFDARGFVVYTDHRSRKGRELDANPHAAMAFHWHLLERQVRIVGPTERVARDEAAAYFAGRPRGSQIGAWSSTQSALLPGGRGVLDRDLAEQQARFGDQGPVPIPPHWGGYRIVPTEIEFWQGRTSRLHDRLRYLREPGGEWRLDRLSP